MELIVAMAILGTVVVAMSYAVGLETRALAACYARAVAMEIVDGEMEILLAGAYTEWAEGEHTYPVEAAAAGNLPQGRFVVTRTERRLRLEWRPGQPGTGGPILREAGLP